MKIKSFIGTSKNAVMTQIWVAIKQRLLVVSHTVEGGTMRIISSRIATKPERYIYEES